MSEERETRLFMISPDSRVTPDQLVRYIHALSEGAIVKETCYGCLVQFDRATVRRILDTVRAEYPYEVFSKIRAYPCGDPRRCRAQHGTRPGFSQLEAEWEMLPYIAYGLKSSDNGAEYHEKPERKPLPVNDFKKICEAIR